MFVELANDEEPNSNVTLENVLRTSRPSRRTSLGPQRSGDAREFFTPILRIVDLHLWVVLWLRALKPASRIDWLNRRTFVPQPEGFALDPESLGSGVVVPRHSQRGLVRTFAIRRVECPSRRTRRIAEPGSGDDTAPPRLRGPFSWRRRRHPGRVGSLLGAGSETKLRTEAYERF